MKGRGIIALVVALIMGYSISDRYKRITTERRKAIAKNRKQLLKRSMQNASAENHR